MPTRYFRAGVGTVIYNKQGEVAFFKRNKHPEGIWQFQQGGIDLGEEPTVTLWRELKEEVGLVRAQIETVDEMPGWISYQDLNALTDLSVPRLGQTHRWFFLKLRGDQTIDLADATDDEFSAVMWVSFDEAIKQTSDHKRHVYETLKRHFDTHIAPLLTQ